LSNVENFIKETDTDCPKKNFNLEKVNNLKLICVTK